MDTDITITNSPDNSSSQVHNIINRIEHKLLLPRDDQQLRHQVIHNRIKSLAEPYTHTMQTDKRYFSQTKENRTIDMNYYHSNNKQYRNPQMHHQFNPYADENDSGAHFQLSKSIESHANSNLNNLPRARFFGNDRTNFMNNTETNLIKPKHQSQINTSNFNFYDKYDENAQNAIFTDLLMRNVANNNTTQITQNQMHSSSVVEPQNSTYFMKTNSMKSVNSESSNEMMFKNYDLNDEYWLNFDQ